MTQRQLAAAAGVSRGYVANIERGHADPSLDLVERIALALGLEVRLNATMPIVFGATGQRDLVHARCSGQADRRLRAAGWLTAAEVEVVHGRSHGWIDLLAFNPATGILLVVEVKTRLDDLGAIERQLAWYERSAPDIAMRLGWRPRVVIGWLLVLASDEVEDAVRSNRDVMARAFPIRARAMMEIVAGRSADVGARGVALIDPTSRRHAWLLPSHVDGRRSAAPFAGYRDAAQRMPG